MAGRRRTAAIRRTLAAVCWRRSAVDCVKVVPSHLAALAAAGRDGLVAGRGRWCCGGEALPGRVVRELVAAAGPAAVFNVYGPTETTVGMLTRGR